ncbi:glycosyltransferase family 4 protein [Photorhabdus sp. RM96S]|uniref:glycosyltransferase family 4 protein n=1 Tax=Photorhabdus sp. RM96S TaxID=3342822 RepID=UPI0036DEDF80
MIIIDGIIFSLQNAGGISVYYNELLKRLKKSEINHTLYLYNNNNKIISKEEIVTPQISKTRLNINLERYLNFPLLEEKPNTIFHSSYYRLPYTKNKSTKIITTVHDFTYEKFSPFFKRNIHHWQKQRAIINSDIIICISENTKNDLIEYIPQAVNKDIRVIYNGVSDDFHKINNKITFNKRFVLFIGARDGYKNFTNAVKALKNRDDLELRIVGGGPLNEKEKILLDDNIKNRYIKIDYITNKDLNLLYNHAYALLYPSLYEGFGIPLLEAMKAGCPVIASNSSSIPEIASDCALLLESPNFKNIFSALEILENLNSRENLIKKGLIQSSLFSWDKTFSQLNNVYNELIG